MVTHNTSMIDFVHSEQPSIEAFDRLTQSLDPFQERYNKLAQRHASMTSNDDEGNSRYDAFNAKMSNLKSSLQQVQALKKTHSQSLVVEDQFSKLVLQMDNPLTTETLPDQPTYEASKSYFKQSSTYFSDMKTYYDRHKENQDTYSETLDDVKRKFDAVKQHVSDNMKKFNTKINSKEMEKTFQEKVSALTTKRDVLEKKLNAIRSEHVDHYTAWENKFAIVSFESGVTSLSSAWKNDTASNKQLENLDNLDLEGVLKLYKDRMHSYEVLQKQQKELQDELNEFKQKYPPMLNHLHVDDEKKRELNDKIHNQETRLKGVESKLNELKSKPPEFRIKIINALDAEFKTQLTGIQDAIRTKDYTKLESYTKEPSPFKDMMKRQEQLELAFKAEEPNRQKWWSTENKALFDNTLSEAKRVYDTFKKQKAVLEKIITVLRNPKWRSTTWFGLPTGIPMMLKLLDHPDALKDPAKTLDAFKRISGLRLKEHLGFFGQMIQNPHSRRLYGYIQRLDVNADTDVAKIERELDDINRLAPVSTSTRPSSFPTRPPG